MRTGLSAAVVCLWFVTGAAPYGEAATPPVPTISPAVDRARLDVSEPGGQRRADRGQGRGLPVRHRGVLRLRHREGRALHDAHHRPPAEGSRHVQRRGRIGGAARRRPIAGLRVVARVDPDAPPHVRGDRAQPREHQPAEDVQRRTLRVAEHRDGADQRRHRAGRHADQERHWSVRRVQRPEDHADGDVGIERDRPQLSRRPCRRCAWPTAARSSTASS